MTSEPERTFNARIVPTCVAFALIAVGAALRLARLDAMEFKRDEQEWLTLGIRLLADRLWASPSTWPSHAVLSSNGVANPPLFTWLVAAAWAPTRDPVGVARVIALINIAGLYPLWLWARRRMDVVPALLTLGIVAVSPFTVIFSRKIWNPDLMLPALLLVLWGIEWLRGDRPWRGLAFIVLGGLFVAQLNQAGLIAMLLLPVAIGVQLFFDRRPGVVRRFVRPSPVDAGWLAIAVLVNLVFWLPYVTYVSGVSAATLASRPTVAVFSPELLKSIEAQIVPIDLLSFFAPDRSAFLRGPARAASFYGAVVLGGPLLVYGLWRWLRSPLSQPVLGIWWWSIVAVFTLARIPSHPHYVATLAPIIAALPAGAFDPRFRQPWMSRALTAWRVAYVAALLALTVTTGAWLVNRGGSAGDYGIAFYNRKAQADVIVSRSPGVDRRPPSYTCELSPAEVTWLVEWMVPGRNATMPLSYICSAWVDRDGEPIYQWVMKR
jgi:hypothetical protein